ncbi:MAG TPA: 50S ribosomal protein L30 [Bacteroidetes bacterium]|nr:50S ribosomal protein L30 [Bacteroidota bacterium]
MHTPWHSTGGSLCKRCLTDKKEKSDNMAKIRIIQKKSSIGSTRRQKRTLQALGLRKIDSTVEVEATPQILGMVNKVKHLVTTEEIKA